MKAWPAGRPRALLLDLDDTLVDATAAYCRSLTACGIDPDGGAYARARAHVKACLKASHTSRHHRLLYFKVMQEQGELAGVRGPAALLALYRAYEAAVAADFRAQAAALGRPALLASLRKQVPLAIVTNETCAMQLAKIAAIDPCGTLFAAVVTSEEVGANKPAPAAFVAAAARLGVPLATCWVVGDSFANDIAPMLAASLQTFWTAEFRPYDAQQIPAHARAPVLLQRLDALADLLATA